MILATTVSRGKTKGQHGALYEINIERGSADCVYRYDQPIDFSGRGGDRGLRGIATWDNKIYVCTADEVLVLNKQYELVETLKHHLLGWLHEACISGDMLYVVSTKYDSVLGYNLTNGLWTMGIKLDEKQNFLYFEPDYVVFDVSNNWHLNSLSPDCLSGLRTTHILSDRGRKIHPLPAGTHNTRIVRDQIFYNDTAQNTVILDSKQYKFSDEYTHLRGVAFTSDNIVVGQDPASIHVLDYDLNLVKSIDIRDKKACIQSLLFVDR